MDAVPDPYAIVGDKEGAPAATGWGAPSPASGGFSLFGALPAETRTPKASDKKNEDKVGEKRTAEEEAEKDKPKKAKGIEDVAGTLKKVLKMLKQESSMELSTKFASTCSILKKCLNEGATKQEENLLVSCLASAVGPSSQRLDSQEYQGPLMDVLEAAAKQGSDIFSEKAIYQIGLWRVQGSTYLILNIAFEEWEPFAIECDFLKQQVSEWCDTTEGPAMTDKRWPELSSQALASVYARSDMRATDALKNISELFEVACMKLEPKVDTNLQRDLKEMSTTIKTCKYDPSKLIQTVNMGAMDSRGRPIVRELSDQMDDLEEMESY